MIHEEEGGTAAVSRVADTDINESLRAQLQSLLQVSFPGYPDREYFKLPPHFRYLAIADGAVAAQMGVEFRMIRVGESVARTFGVVDLCVAESRRCQDLASRLLAEVTASARACGMDSSSCLPTTVAFTRERMGSGRQRCSWVKIPRARDNGLATQESQDFMMVKPIAARAWPDGDVGLLGHMF